MFIIKWYVKATGFKGQGSPIREADARAWVKQLNNDWPNLHHYCEEV